MAISEIYSSIKDEKRLVLRVDKINNIDEKEKLCLISLYKQKDRDIFPGWMLFQAPKRLYTGPKLNLAHIQHGELLTLLSWC